MKKAWLWVISVIVTLFLLVFQRMTGPTYPLRGNVEIAGKRISYRLPRTHETTADCEVRIDRAAPGMTASLVYRRFKTGDPFVMLPMSVEGEQLSARLPKQPRAGKLEYRVMVFLDGEETSLSGNRPVIIRFKDPVPAPVVIAHVIAIFLAFLFSTRTGLEALRRDGRPRRLAMWTVAFLVLGGMILGPVMQKFAFNAFWTGIPFGHDLTDNKTLIALIGWIAALIAGRKGRPARGWTVAASLLLLIVFLVPHSVLGSELDYSKIDPSSQTAVAGVRIPPDVITSA